MSNKMRLLPEWHGHSAVLLSWPHADTDWVYMLPVVRECYIDLIAKLTKAARVIIVAPDISDVANALRGYVDMDRIRLAQMPTDDTWARDFGMICTADHGRWVANDFKFNGWGLKFRAANDNLITRHLLASGLIDDSVVYANRLGFVLEGGSIDIDHDGTLLTTSECLMSPNRNGDLTRDQIEAVLIDALGCQKVIWIESGALAGDDTDSHIDTLARFLPGRKIAYSACDRSDDEHYDCLKLMERELRDVTDTEGLPYQLVPLPIPEAIYDSDGQRLPATYANFLIVNHALFMPVYGDEHYDALAMEAMRRALPDYEVYTVDCRALIQQHGSLHCVTMQIPDAIVR